MCPRLVAWIELGDLDKYPITVVGKTLKGIEVGDIINIGGCIQEHSDKFEPFLGRAMERVQER